MFYFVLYISLLTALFFIIQYLPVFELWKMWGYGLVHVHICFHECVLILFFLLNPLIPHDFGMKQKKQKTKILKRMHKTLFYSLFIYIVWDSFQLRHFHIKFGSSGINITILICYYCKSKMGVKQQPTFRTWKWATCTNYCTNIHICQYHFYPAVVFLLAEAWRYCVWNPWFWFIR